MVLFKLYIISLIFAHMGIAGLGGEILESVFMKIIIENIFLRIPFE